MSESFIYIKTYNFCADRGNVFGDQVLLIHSFFQILWYIYAIISTKVIITWKRRLVNFISVIVFIILFLSKYLFNIPIENEHCPSVYFDTIRSLPQADIGFLCSFLVSYGIYYYIKYGPISIPLLFSYLLGYIFVTLQIYLSYMASLFNIIITTIISILLTLLLYKLDLYLLETLEINKESYE